MGVNQPPEAIGLVDLYREEVNEAPEAVDLGKGPIRQVTVGIVFVSIAWITFFMRFYARRIMLKTWGTDDWFILLTMVCYSFQCAYLMMAGFIMMNPEPLLTKIPALAALITDIIVGSAAYVATSISLKISLAFFFLRIVNVKWERRVIYSITVIFTIYGVVYFFLVLFGCGNPKLYMFHTAENTCVSVKHVVIPMTYAATAANGFVDWVFVILPLHALWNLQMPRITKIWASLLVLMGALGSVISLIRLGSVSGLTPDAAYLRNSATPIILATVEAGLGITAVNLATTRPLFKELLGKMGSRFMGSSQNKSSNMDGTAASGFKGRGQVDLVSKPRRVSFGSKPNPMRVGFREVDSSNGSEDGVELTRVSQDDLARLGLARTTTRGVSSPEELERGTSSDGPYQLQRPAF